MFLHEVMQRDKARAKFNCTCIARAGPRHASTNLYYVLVVCLLARLFLVLLAPSVVCLWENQTNRLEALFPLGALLSAQPEPWTAPPKTIGALWRSVLFFDAF